MWDIYWKSVYDELVKNSELYKGLLEENKKLKEDTEHTIKFNNKIIGELKLENKKLKADYIKLSKIVETTWWYKASYVNELRDKIAKLEKKLKTVTEGEIIIPIYDEEGKLVMK